PSPPLPSLPARRSSDLAFQPENGVPAEFQAQEQVAAARCLAAEPQAAAFTAGGGNGDVDGFAVNRYRDLATVPGGQQVEFQLRLDRKSTRLNSSHVSTS